MKMQLRFLGVGSQFSGREQYHSNMVLTAASGKRLLIDCGSDARYSLFESGLTPADLDAVYVSHLHADHIGGLEWLALSTHFSPAPRRLPLFAETQTLEWLWEHALRAGLRCIQGKSMELADYFEPCPVASGGSFQWEGVQLTTHRMPHISNENSRHDSHALFIESGACRAFISTDTQFLPEFIESMAQQADLIFHDCETIPFKTTVHAHYEELRTLSARARAKIWLYHNQAGHGYNAVKDGFAGFVVKGQEFDLPEAL